MARFRAWLRGSYEEYPEPALESLCDGVVVALEMQRSTGVNGRRSRVLSCAALIRVVPPSLRSLTGMEALFDSIKSVSKQKQSQR